MITLANYSGFCISYFTAATTTAAGAEGTTTTAAEAEGTTTPASPTDCTFKHFHEELSWFSFCFKQPKYKYNYYVQ